MMNFFLRKDQVFKFNCLIGLEGNKPTKYLVAIDYDDTTNLRTDNYEGVITTSCIEKRRGGWERQYGSEVDCTIRDRSVLNALFQVVEVAMSKSGDDYQDLPDGRFVKAKRIDGDETVSFYQSGYFVGLIDPQDVDLIFGPEDKHTILKCIWVEE